MAYVALNVAYSRGLKSVPLLDVAILASGYALRVLYGAVACGVTVSGWLYLTVLAGSFCLGLGKRRGELDAAVAGSRSALQGYTRGFLDKNMYVCLGLAACFYALWAREGAGRLWTVMERDMKDRLYVIIPAYNEEDNIDRCVRDWYPIVERYGDFSSRLVVIDDGSTDSTLERLRGMADEHPLLVPLTKPNDGHGATVLFGYRYAIEDGADWVFQTDSDGQTNPAEFGQFWEKRNEFDAVLGNRVVRGDGMGRKFVEDMVCLLLRVIFGVSVEDANAPFRLMRAELLQKYIDKLPDDFNIPNIMFTTYFAYNHEKVLFLPISFRPREKGTNTINPEFPALP